MGLRHRLYLKKEWVKNNYLIPVCRKSRFLSDLYYLCFSNEFSREHQKVLQGKYMHLKALKDQRPNAFHLRRQVHRLEKGLIMKEKRGLFALDYILHTVRSYKTIAADMATGAIGADDDLLRWTEQVLRNYFAVVATHPTVDAARTLFESNGTGTLCRQDSCETLQRIPYLRADVRPAEVTYEALLSLAIQRRSVRWYQARDVDRALIEKAVSIASLSPSACNRQPFEFRIYDQESMKNQVGGIPMGIRPFHKQIPVFVVLVGKLSAYLSERDRHVIYIDGGLAAMSFMLALETLGLSSVPINWPDIEEFEKQMEGTITLGSDERPLLLIGVGYADQQGKIPFSQKKAPDVLIKYNEGHDLATVD
ncbi:nitroreductase family protein [Parapedobacter sp.]